MSSIFPNTSITLLQSIAAERTGGDEAEWARFFELYYPAMRKFVQMKTSRSDADDIVQDVLVKLVDVLRHGKYTPQPGVKFRSYLARLLYNELVSHFRRDRVRGDGNFVPVDEVDLPVDNDAAIGLDVQWRMALHQSAVEHVLTKTALAEQSKDVYREYVIEERPIAEVAKKFGLTKNYVSQIKTRVDRMVSAVEAQYGD